MTPNIVLRSATLADAALIAATVRAAFEEYRGKITPPSSSHNESEDAVAAKLKKGGGVLAYVDDALAGVVLYYPDADDSLYLGRLAVLHEFRRFGVGKLLVHDVETRAKAAGYKQVRLFVRIQLTQNRQFFEAMGYTVSSYEKHDGYAELTFMTLTRQV